MSRIRQRFAELAREGRRALVPYITAGDPHPGQTVSLMHALVEAGADLIELGVPFSDPMADGPVIQAACERALAHGTSLQDVLEMVRDFRQQDPETPVVLMGYQNPIEVVGAREFARRANQCQVDGVLTVDLPFEQAEETLEIYRQHSLDTIFLIAPTTSPSRIEKICENSSGLIYYVSLRGVTGAGHLDIVEVEKKVNEIRQYTSLPVGVGFGVQDAESARDIAMIADAVIVGSALIRLIEYSATDYEAIKKNLSALLAGMREAMDVCTRGQEPARAQP
ncbi:MAG: tryptophan synthase subunit alpha [Gammaproteobacteria bacterium]|nr:tryptophan synthase subunit alpha [Gammaproteobacteria bacterium]MDE0410923.1 tryptophan synthase subunit alpha [Gammaproteobacteria bacterium]